MSTYVCYHLPSDRDDAEHPNAFAINKPTEDVTLADIKEAFPLPGEYHFRFKVKMDTGSYWIDFTRDQDVVPAYGHRRIVAKVLRLSWDPRVTAPVSKVSTPPASVVNVKQTVPDHVDLFGGSTPAQRSAVAGPSHGGVTEFDLFS